MRKKWKRGDFGGEKGYVQWELENYRQFNITRTKPRRITLFYDSNCREENGWDIKVEWRRLSWKRKVSAELRI